MAAGFVVGKGVRIRLADRDSEVVVAEADCPEPVTADAALREAATEHLGVKPAAVELFGLRVAQGGGPSPSLPGSDGPFSCRSHQQQQLWLAPGALLDTSGRDTAGVRTPSAVAELRLRFKTPLAMKLHEVDRNAFNYYYRQVKNDFVSNVVLSAAARKAAAPSSSSSALAPSAESGPFQQHQQQQQGLNQRQETSSSTSSFTVPNGPPNCQAPADIRKKRWWNLMDGREGGVESQRRARRSELLRKITRLSCLAMTIDILEKDLTQSKVVEEADKYLPRGMWSSRAEKNLVFRDFTKTFVNDVITKWMERKLSPVSLKVAFLNDVSRHFGAYHVEEYEASCLRPDVASYSPVPVILRLLPPSKMAHPPFEETEPCLEAEELSKCAVGRTRHRLQQLREEELPSSTSSAPKKLCDLDEVCNLSLADDGINVQLGRKNGIPLYFRFRTSAEASSLLSLLSGYYRLCEAWTFPLCNEIIFPRLLELLKDHVHGPLDPEFVERKFTVAEKRRRGAFMIRQSCDVDNLYFLHHIPYDSSSKTEVLHIVKAGRSGGFRLNVEPVEGLPKLTEVHDSIGSIVRMIKAVANDSRPMSASAVACSSRTLPVLKECLHPSEFDRAPTLLLCRSMAKLEDDLKGNKAISGGYQAPVFIPFTSLSRYENCKYPGTRTDVWKGVWAKSRDEKLTVAVKQLKQDLHQQQHHRTLLDFIHACHNIMLWNDATLRKVYGTSLATPNNPLTLIMEYFSLGPLDVYLRENGNCVQPVDLVEAATSLARALWYLEEQGLLHGKIRCRKLFVASHEEGSKFKVKLGDPGLIDYSDPADVHWIPPEFHLALAFSSSSSVMDGDVNGGSSQARASCHQNKSAAVSLAPTVSSEVWSYATTVWEIFSFGKTPLPDMSSAASRQRYLNGFVLPKPQALKDTLSQVYFDVMLSCWNSDPAARKVPQAIMKDMNQILYRVFNSKKLPNYVSIEGFSPEVEAGNGCAETPATGCEDKGAPDREDHTLTPLTSESSSTQSFQEFGDFLLPLNTAAAASNASRLLASRHDLLKRFRDQESMFGISGTGNVGILDPESSGSQQALLSSMSEEVEQSNSEFGDSFMNNWSQFTSQTTLASYHTHYSMSSIYQLSRESQLELNRDVPLGQGNFGVVYKGVLTRSNGAWDSVAVKTVRQHCSNHTFEALQDMKRELEIMKSLDHINVVKIKAVLPDEGLIIMEYVSQGSLDNYLKMNRNQVKFPAQLFLYAYSIVDGMIYLSSRGILHRDLAARNILVEDEETVKISDFGLARLMDNKDYYVMNSNMNIPVKWLAIECLNHKLYSQASDVWSFGVVLWEMFSFGRTPYMVGCENFFAANGDEHQILQDWRRWVHKLETGVRLPRPDMCPVTVYNDLMTPCWNADPSLRPQFPELRGMLRKVEPKVT